MSKMKEKNLRRFVAIYIAGSIAFGGVAYAEEEPNFLDGAETPINNAEYADSSVYGGSLGRDVASSSITIGGSGDVSELIGGGYAQGNSAQANVGQATIAVNGGSVVDLIGGGQAVDGGTANITGKSTVTIANGTVENVTAGGIASSGNVSVAESEITISGNSQIGLIQGGGDAQGNGATSTVTKSTITINGGTIGIVNDEIEGGPIFGGGYATAATTSGQENKSNVTDVTININNSTFQNSLYGGGGSFDKGEDDLTAGQGNASTQVETVKITVDSATKTVGDDVAFYAGGKTSGANTTASVTNASITVKGAAALDELYGGGDSYRGAATVGTATLSIEGDAKVNTVYGGGFSEAGSSSVTTSKIYIKDNAVVGNVYGGGETDEESTENRSAAVTTSTIEVSGGQIGNLYAGGADANSQVADSTINISGGKISGNISAANVTGTKTLNFTQGEGSIVDGTISGYDTATVKQGATTTLTGAAMAADASHSFTSLTVEQQGTLNIGGGKFAADITGAGAGSESALHFTAGKGSTIGGTISGFDAVTVANGAKTDWTKETATHTFGSLTVEEGGEINITGTAVTFDFGASTSAALLRSARAVQDGDFLVNGSVNLAQGTTLTLQNGVVETGSNGAFVSAVDKDNYGNSGKLAWNSSTVKDNTNLHIDFTGISANELEAMGKTDGFGDLLKDIVGNPTSANGDPVTITNRNNPTSETTFEATLDQSGETPTITITEAPRVSERGFSYYTSARQGNAYIAQNIVNHIHEHTAGLRNGEETDNFWAGIRGGSTDVDTRFGDAEVKTQFYQLGYDWDLSANDKKAAVGLYFTKIEGDMKQRGVKNDLESAYDFGIYGMQELDGGNYLSLIGRYGRIGNSLHINDTAVEWKDKGYGLSLEFGNRHAQTNGLLLEPYIQLNYNHLSSASFVTSLGTSVSMDSSSLFDGKIGLRLIQQETNNPNNTVYGGIAYTRGLSGDFSMKANQGTNLINEDNDANAFELAIGMTRQISGCSTVNLNAKKEFGDYDGWSLEGMIQVAF